MSNDLSNEFYILKADNPEPFGPISEGTVKEWIAQKRISTLDMITAKGREEWIPITASQFATDITTLMSREEIESTRCPHCGRNLVIMHKSSSTGLWLIIIGVILTPVFCIGTALWVWGMMLRHGTKGKFYYECPQCRWKSAGI